MGLFEKAGVNKKLFFVLLTVCILGNLTVLPYANSLGLLRFEQMPVPASVVILVFIIQSAVYSSVAIFFGLLLAKKVGFGAPLLEDWLYGNPVKIPLKLIVIRPVFLGIFLGIILFVLDQYVFGLLVEPVTTFQAKPPVWQRILVSFYGGICEEVFMRLFLMTLIVWLSTKIKKTDYGSPTHFGIWLAIILVSVIFGLGHLPMTATFMEITSIVVIRGLVLNSLAGIIFGWLYWKRGLESAIVSHFSTDIALHAILASLI